MIRRFAAADSGPVNPLEQQRLRAGHYRIEGHDVTRRPARALWRITFCGAFVAEFGTLRECKEYLADH